MNNSDFIPVDKLINNYEHLFELGTVPLDTTNDLDDSLKNFSMASVFYDMDKRVGTFDNKFQIYRIIGKNIIYDAFLGEGPKIHAYFSYTLKNNIMEINYVWQNFLRLGCCRELIFKFYLDHYGGVLSSNFHNERGKRFWEKLLIEAIDKKYRVSVENKYNNTSNIITHMSDFNSYYSWLYNQFLIKKYE